MFKDRFKGVVLSILVTILLSTSVNAFDIGSDIPVDKRLHGLCGYVITDMLHEKAGLSGLDLFLWFNAIGISKELLDQAYGGKFDTNDLIANNAGYLWYNVIRIKF